MSKKISLKDAFVRNVQETVHTENPVVVSTALQAHSYTDVQLSGRVGIVKKKANFNLDPSLHQRLKVTAAMHNREMVDIVEDALQSYLAKLEQRAG
jgi:hypothetical protein